MSHKPFVIKDFEYDVTKGDHLVKDPIRTLVLPSYAEMNDKLSKAYGEIQGLQKQNAELVIIEHNQRYRENQLHADLSVARNEVDKLTASEQTWLRNYNEVLGEVIGLKRYSVQLEKELLNTQSSLNRANANNNTHQLVVKVLTEKLQYFEAGYKDKIKELETKLGEQKEVISSLKAELEMCVDAVTFG